MGTIWSYVAGAVFSALIVGQLGWAARMLLKHAEILASVTTELKQLPTIQTEIGEVQSTVSAIQLEQMRVKTQLAHVMGGGA